jgi:VIT1/CCC1 family predicted Fe2+/Mn2+ transporter
MAGVIGANLPPGVVIILGVANLLADGFSMAAANYTGTKAELDEYRQLRRMEERHVDLTPDGEREEIRQIFRSKGFAGEALEKAVSVITERRERWIDTMMAEEHGMPAAIRSPLRAALMTFIAFVLCGSVPILPYALKLSDPLWPATIMSGLTFFAIGSLRSHWSPAPWWRAGLETFAIGMAAAGVAYVVGVLLKGLV